MFGEFNVAAPCCIGLKYGNEVRVINCRRDGSLDKAGIILQLGYTEIKKVKELIALGDLYSLGFNVMAPKQFTDKDTAVKYYRRMYQHLLTTFCLTFKRDLGFDYSGICGHSMSYVAFLNINDVRKSVYYFDVISKQWYVVTNQQAFVLAQVLTDENIFKQYCNVKNICLDPWSALLLAVDTAKLLLEEKKGFSIIECYNRWKNTEAAYVDLPIEFGYAMQNGKQVYALWPKNVANGQKRRKPIICSNCIGDLVAYLEDNY